MAGYIPRDFINDLLARVDIVDVIDSRVKLKKRGKNHIACCPFHQEKTPSFSVNQSKQFFHCFGCGESGNAIDFLMKYDRLEFVESIEELAASQGLDVPYENPKGGSRLGRDARINLTEIMTSISSFYQQKLLTPEGNLAVKYLQNRGLTKAVVDAYAIGYAPRFALLHQFGKTPEAQAILKDLGMLGESDDKKVYERFRDRVMFPIRDKRGRIIGFGGRIIDQGMPKYLNSPETLLFQKSKHLYGLYEVFKYDPEPEQIMMVEGYMDVVALAQFGIHYAVATLGTATSSEHLQLLFRTVDTVICCYDGDKAGREAAWRALNAALPQLIDGKQVQFVFLPDGEDPDTLIRKIGKDAFEVMLKQSKGYDQFLFEQLSKDIDLTTQQGKTKFSSLVIPLIKSVPGITHQILLKKALGNMIGVLNTEQLDRIFSSYEAAFKDKVPQLNAKNAGNNVGFSKNSSYMAATQPRSSVLMPTKVHNSFLRRLVALLVQNPNLAKLVPSTEGFDAHLFPELEVFNLIVNECRSQAQINMAQLMVLLKESRTIHEKPQLMQIINEYAIWDHEISEELVESSFLDDLASLYDALLEQRLDFLIAKDRMQRNLSVEERYELMELMNVLKKGK